MHPILLGSWLPRTLSEATALNLHALGLFVSDHSRGYWYPTGNNKGTD